MNKCYYCQTTISEKNSSQEHVIPRCLGGRQVSRTLLCKKCNNELGHLLDSKFDKHLDIFFTCLNIPTQQKKPRRKILGLTNGSQIELNSLTGFSKHKPDVDFSSDGSKFSIQVRTKNIEQAKSIIAKYTKETNLQFEEYQVHEIHERPTERESFQFEVPKGSLIPSISKLAINLYLHGSGIPEDIPHLIENLNETISFTGVYFFYRDQRLKSSSFNHIFHHVKDPGIGVEYFYFEIFEVLKYLVIIRLDYAGEKKKTSFDINPITKERNEITLPFLLTDERLKRIVENQKLHEERLESHFKGKLNEALRAFNSRTKLTPLNRR